MNKRRSFRFPPVGGSSLLVIFSVLCLTVFALLSLSTAQAGSRLSTRSAEAVTAYYEADTRAQHILAQLRAGKQPEGVLLTHGIHSFTVPLSDTQALEVSVRLKGESCTILQWQYVSTTDWQPDTSLDLWNGQSNEEEPK